MPNPLETRRIPDYVAVEVYDRFCELVKGGLGRMQAYETIGAEYEKSPEAIRKLLDRFRPRTDLAREYIKASAFRMAKRIVREADPGILVDVLSRSNIGVLAPKQAAEGGSNHGFFLSVQADSCGAVKVSAASVPSIPSDTISPVNPFEVPDGEITPRPTQSLQRSRFFGRGSAATIENARARLQQAREQRDRERRRSGAGRSYLGGRSPEDEGLQEPDGHVEPEGESGDQAPEER